MEIEGTAMDYTKKILDLEAKCDRLEVKKTMLIGNVKGLQAKEEMTKEKYMKWKDRCVKMQEKFNSEKSKWAEETIKIGEECSQMVAEKKMLDIDLKAAEERFKSLLEQREGPATNLSGKKIKALERRNSQLEFDLNATKMRSQELEKALSDLKRLCEEEDGSIIVPERGKRKALGNGNSECSGKKIEAERSRASNVLEAEKEMARARKKINELLERIAVLEAEMEAEKSDKRAIEEEHRKKLLELTQSIQVLEGEKTEMEAKLIQATRDSREEMKRISFEKMAVEAEKRAIKDASDKEVLEKARRIEVLEWEIKEMEFEVSEGKREKNEEISRILNENTTLKEKHEKKNLELVSRAVGLEREKKQVEEEACKAMRDALKEKDDKIEEIKRILNEKSCLKEQHDKKVLEFVSRVDVLGRHMEAEKAALKERNSELVVRVDVLEKEKSGFEIETRKKNGMIKVLVQQNEYLMTKKGIAEMETNKCTPIAQKQGHRNVDKSVKKFKRQKVGCSTSKQVAIKRSKSESVWTTKEKMLKAITTDDELCMRSICALYRKHKSLGRWQNCSASSISNNGLMTPCEERGMALGELLTSGDPKGMLKMSLAEFKRANPCGLVNCRLIAIHYCKELFDIYRSNLDPLFLSGDDRN